MKKRRFEAPSGAELNFTELGFGAAPLGNLYRPHSNEDALATFESAWKEGIRYFDTAPLYGLGLSETRLGNFLYGKKRSEYIVSTKVGRVLEMSTPSERTAIGKFFDTPSRREKFDYSYDGFMRSFEFSFERLGLDSIDVLLVHDCDVWTHGSKAASDEHISTVMKSGYKALLKLREEKVIKAFGVGVNEWQVCQTMAEQGDFDLFLLAGRYTLLEQEQSLNSFLPLCEKRGIGIILGGPYNSGILATGAKKGAFYNYEAAPKAILDRVGKIEKVCNSNEVKIAQAALRFPLTHPAVVTVLAGAASPKEVAQNVKTMSAKIPKAVWKQLKAEGLLDPRAPTP
jgi:D-threo-aldose 1-dehydrogenase